MSLTETEKQWLRGCVFATAASKSDVNVAIPHLRGGWSPTKAIFRTLAVSFITLSLRPEAFSTPSINRIPPVALKLENEADPLGFVAPGSSRGQTVAFL